MSLASAFFCKNPSCGASIEHKLGVDLCTNCMLIGRWLRDFRSFFSEVYMPEAKLTEEQEGIAAYFQRQIDNGLPVKLAIQKGRRVGASEICCAFDLWYAIRSTGKKSIGIFSLRADTAKSLFREKIHVAISNNPWLMSLVMQVGKENKLLEQSVRFGNDTRIYADTAGEHAGRGYDLDLGHFTEAAFIAENFYTAALQATLSGDSHIILESTPDEMHGTFYKACMGESEAYKRFYIPSFELDDKGMKLVMSGMHFHLTPEHFTKINAVNATYTKLMELMAEMTSQDVRKEYLGEFVSGTELMYPPSLYDPLTNITGDMLLYRGLYASKEEMKDDLEAAENQSEDMDRIGKKAFVETHLTRVLGDVRRWRTMQEREMRNGIQPWKFALGIDWGRRDWTVVTVWAVEKATDHFMLLDVISWNKIEYEDSYQRILAIYQKWADAGQVEVMTDATAMQDQALAALRHLGVNPVYGFIMTSKSKKAVAFTLFNMMQQKKIRFYKHAQMRTGILSVNYDVKSDTGHLSDFAASVLVAIHRVQLAGMAETGADMDISKMIFQV